jgi:hypothetical protein
MLDILYFINWLRVQFTFDVPMIHNPRLYSTHYLIKLLGISYGMIQRIVGKMNPFSRHVMIVFVEANGHQHT